MKPWMAVAIVDDPGRLIEVAHGSITTRGPYLGVVLAASDAHVLHGNFNLLGSFDDPSEAHGAVQEWAANWSEPDLYA